MTLESRRLVFLHYGSHDLPRRSPHFTYKVRDKEVKVLPRVPHARWLVARGPHYEGNGQLPMAQPWKGKVQRALDFDFSGILLQSSNIFIALALPLFDQIILQSLLPRVPRSSLSRHFECDAEAHSGGWTAQTELYLRVLSLSMNWASLC